MKRLYIWLFILPSFTFAQDKHIMIQGEAPNLFINHSVVPKDNYYSIGRLYNVSPKEMAAYNNLQMDQGLNLGQVVKIPLAANNFTQTNVVAADEALVPLYYTVKPKEGLYRVSTVNNKLPIATIKQWNKLSSDAVNAGTHLIVGYLKVKKDLSALANGNTEVAMEDKKPVERPGKDTKKEPDSQKMPQTQTPPVVQAPPVEQPKNEEPVKSQPPVEQPAKAEPAYTTDKDFKGGTFKALYQSKNEITEEGDAGVFKSTSGWEDGKYYCLHNSAQPQTIIKITSNATGKTIYAKVMDVMPDIKQNKGKIILISNAAAHQLGITENKFSCTISYSK